MRFQPALLLVLAACTGSSETPAPESSSATQVASAAPVTSSPAVSPAGAPATVPNPALRAVVYKDANCGCCSKWVDHLRDAGFTVIANDVTNLNEIKRRHSVPPPLYSCHTAEVGRYVVEGHVPADVIRKMLDEQPDIAGIAVGGMPMGSPGMEGPYSEPYEVVAFTKTGATSVYARR